MGECEKSQDPKAVAAFAADPSLASPGRSCLQERKPSCFHTTAASGPRPRSQPPGTPSRGEGRGVTPALPARSGALRGLRSFSPGIAATFQTPHQLGRLAGHLGASSRAAKDPGSRGGFGCLPPWRAQLSVPEPLRALPAPAGAGSESRDKRPCVLLPAASPADRPPAQLNRARFPCGEGRPAGWQTPPTLQPTGPWGPPTPRDLPGTLPPAPGEDTSSDSPHPQASPLPPPHFLHTLGVPAPADAGGEGLSIPRGLGRDETRQQQQPWPQREGPRSPARCHIHLVGPENPSP